MESSSSYSEERELQQMQLEERELNQKCLTWFKARLSRSRSHLGSFLSLQDQDRKIRSRSRLVGSTMRLYEIAFQIFFQEENKTFSMKTYHNMNQLQWPLERKNLYSSNLKSYLEVLRTPFKEFFDSKEMKEKEVQAIKEIEKWLKESEMQKQESLVSKGAALETGLVTEGTSLEDCLVIDGA
ncbi:hypothetical protein Tco_0695721 [Tanacetum coccineum]